MIIEFTPEESSRIRVRENFDFKHRMVLIPWFILCLGSQIGSMILAHPGVVVPTLVSVAVVWLNFKADLRLIFLKDHPGRTDLESPKLVRELLAHRDFIKVSSPKILNAYSKNGELLIFKNFYSKNNIYFVQLVPYAEISQRD